MQDIPLIEELRQQRPELAARADAGSLGAAIYLFCLTCMGGVRAEIVRCTDTTCPLYPHRLGRNTLRQRQMTDEQRAAAGERFRAMRAAGQLARIHARAIRPLEVDEP
jgi:hypothetical protein